MAGLLDFLTGGLLGGQAPQQQPPAPFQGGNDPFGAAFQNFAHGRTLIGGLADAFQGAATGQRTDPVGMYQQMAGMTYKALLDAGVPEPQARLGATNPDVQKAITAKMFPTYQFHNIGNTALSGNPATGQLTPQYIAPEFKTVAPGDTGISYQPPLVGGAPGGVPRPGPVQGGPLPPPPGAAGPVPLGQGAPGTTTAPPGRPPPAPVGQGGSQVLVPGMSLQEKAAQQAAGTVQGQTLAGLPGIKVNTEMALSLADKLTNHPGAKFALGAASILPTAPGSPQANFRALLEQAKSGVFRQAAHDLRGLGSLSNTEGSKLENSTARLETTQDPTAFNEALGEYKKYLQKGWANAQAIARGEMQPYATAPLEQPSAGAKTAPSAAPPAAAVSHLKSNPSLRDQFDAKYGPGAALRALGG